jgi:tryptophan halogenase
MCILPRRFRARTHISAPIDEQTYYRSLKTEFANFWTDGSYYCIFSRMGLQPDVPVPSLSYRPESVEQAGAYFTRIRHESRSS